MIYRSKMHAGLKRNFQVMPGAEWLALLCQHIPDRYEHLVRYVGWYSNRARGERAKKAGLSAGLVLFAARSARRRRPFQFQHGRATDAVGTGGPGRGVQEPDALAREEG